MDDLREILYEDQLMATVYSGEEILPKGSTPRVGCTNVSDRQTIDDRQTTDGIATAKTRTYRSHVRVKIKCRMERSKIPGNSRGNFSKDIFPGVPEREFPVALV